MLDLRGLLGDDVFDAFMHHIALGRYSLLLGAGSSADSTDQFGQSMPVGNKLRDEIASAFDLKDADDKSLKRVYAIAKELTDSSGSSFADFIRARFTQTNPAEWLKGLLRIQWDSMWTLNIDDTIERAHFQLGDGARQQLKSVSWTDRHYQADRKLDQLVLVHLHGKAHRANKANELIFDISGYTSSLQEQHRWLKIFGDEYPAKPFIVIGASIDEEIDLQDVFDSGRLTKSIAPSLIVLKSIDAFQEKEYRRYGLTPVAATGEAFIEAVQRALPEYLGRLTDDQVELTEATPKIGVRYLSQWKRLSGSTQTRKPDRHDLYLGHEPTWYDATHGFISRRPVVKKVKAELARLEKEQLAGTVLLLGEAFNGKSSVSFRVARELDEDGYRPWLFMGDSAMDTDATLYWLQREPKAVLIVDNASDFAQDAKELLAEAKQRNIPAKLLLVERARRGQHVRDTLVDEVCIPTFVSSRLTDTEISNLIATLSTKKRLGAITNLSKTEREAFFKEHDRKLFSVMAALEDGRGFQQRVSDELAKATSQKQRDLLSAVALCSRLGYPLPFSLVRTAANTTPLEVESLVGHDLADLLEAGSDGVRTRHRIFGELLLEELDFDARMSAIVRLALAVAPHLSPQAIHEGTLHYRMARGLMGAEFLAETLGSNNKVVLHVYEELEEAYDWNARYWEQRALAAADANLYEPAFSWAQQAVLRRRDALSLTTTGKVLMLRALSEAATGQWPTRTFDSAEETLREARELEGSRAEYPIETFLTYIVRLTRLVPDRDAALNEQLRLLWSDWFNAILNLDTASQARLARVREESVTAWERAWPQSR